jgi:hypothetical protein
MLRSVSSRQAGTLASFRDAHHDQVIIVCGCGPSLNSLEHPERFVTIGVNDVGRLFDPTYLVVVNPRTQFKGDRFRYVEQSNARALFTQLDLGPVRPPVVRFRLGKYGGTELGAADVLHHTQNSPYVAVCLAAYMGARQIGLIGVDLTDDHFFGRTGRHPLAGRLGEIDTQYGRLARALQQRGIALVSLSAMSRLTSLPKRSVESLAEPGQGGPTIDQARSSLQIVSYATTPIAGVPAILARCIAGVTEHAARCVWAADGYGNGVRFAGDVQWNQTPREAMDLLEAADLVIVHNGKVAPPHLRLLDTKPVVTMAHNYGWNVDTRFVQRGHPGVVIGQYQATLPEFAQWAVVPSPMPLWEPAYSPGPKPDQLAIAFTPSGRHERYPLGHRLYWHGKGFDTTMRVLERLARRSSVRLETTAQRQVTHDEALEMKRRAHIVIDECVTGSYHRNSLEGLAAGCVVVNGVGLLPGVREALVRCAGDCPDDLFVVATLESLEAQLDGLLALGAAELCRRGLRGRSWMESHWGFKTHWETHWRPVIERALNRSQPGTRTARMQTAPPPAPSKTLSHQPLPSALGLSVVIPFSGVERLDLLATTVAGLRQSPAVHQVIIVELGNRPVATDVARRWGTDYLFVLWQGPFDKSRALNVGSALATNADIAWCDCDLVFTPDFMTRAQQEFRNRRLDFFFPFSHIAYLGELESRDVCMGTRNPADCRAVSSLHAMPGAAIGGVGFVRADMLRRFGGMVEGFRGWGGEDNAWVHKASLVGRVGVTQRKDQVVYHLFHPDSGAIGAQPWRNNPHYQHNVAFLAEIQRIRTATEWLRRFPAPAHWPAPWADAKRIRFVVLGGDHADSAYGLARAWAQRLLESYGTSVRVLSCAVTELGEALRDEAADAIVVFTGDAADVGALAGTDLLRRAIVVLGEGETSEGSDAALAEAAWVLARDVTQIDRLRSSGRRVWHTAWSAPAVDGTPAAPIVVQPLSLLLDDQEEARSAAPRLAASDASDRVLPVWTYWEGPMPDWISQCLETVRWHAPALRVLGPHEFDVLLDRDRDIDLSSLHVAQRADFVRAFVLMRFGGLWIDADCIVQQSLSPLLAQLREFDFVAHRERQGLFSNAFMGAASDSVVARRFYDAVTARLRSRKPLTWIALGNEPLSEVLGATPVHWLELRTEQVQPVCWSQPEAYFRQGNDADHERSFDAEALCYMLSYQNVLRFQRANPGAALTEDRTFFSFLLRRARLATEREHLAPGANHTCDTLGKETEFFAEALLELMPRRVVEVQGSTPRYGTLVYEAVQHEPSLSGTTQPHPCVDAIVVGSTIHGTEFAPVYNSVRAVDPDELLQRADLAADLVIIGSDVAMLGAARLTALVDRAVGAADYVLVAQTSDVTGASADPSKRAAATSPLALASMVRSRAISIGNGSRVAAFLYSHSDPKGLARRQVGTGVYERMCRDHAAQGHESVSGPGSSLAQTAEIRQRLPLLLQGLGARVLLDAPCGDFNWLRDVRLGIESYIGVDLLEHLIRQNRERHAAPGRQFLVIDLFEGPLPAADIVLCRDYLVHLSFESIARVLRNMTMSGSRYLLATTFPGRGPNPDITDGDWRPLNLQAAPLFFPPPLRLINEKCTEGRGAFSDKSLGLWRFQDLPTGHS